MSDLTDTPRWVLVSTLSALNMQYVNSGLTDAQHAERAEVMAEIQRRRCGHRPV